ncbi:MAG: hypothetical protein AB7F86_09250 [Bdellovibrionales bacterium]
MSGLLEFRKNVHSHNGEDGVLSHLIGKLPNSNRWAVEFGAWDGIWASNTCHLLESHNWNVVFIEADKGKFEDLKKNHGDRKTAHLINEFIDFSGDNSLDSLLTGVHGFPADPDIVSMDIDGCEYHLWESLNSVKPKIVLVEFNPTIPLHLKYVQPKDFSINHSSSLTAFCDLAKQKGYALVSVLDYNAIFVRRDLISAMGLEESSPADLFAPFFDKYQTQIWQSMDGRIHLVGCERLLWHNVAISERKLQVLPFFMRFNPAGTGWLRDTLRFFYYKVPLVARLWNFLVSGRFSVPKY